MTSPTPSNVPTDVPQWMTAFVDEVCQIGREREDLLSPQYLITVLKRHATALPGGVREVRAIITDQINAHVAMRQDHRDWLSKDIADRIDALLTAPKTLPEGGAETIFEVVDATDEEQYFPLAIHKTLADAIKAIDVEDPNDIGCHDHEEWEGCVIVEIRERVFGWSGQGKKAHTQKWLSKYDDIKDDYLWSRSALPSPTKEAK